LNSIKDAVAFSGEAAGCDFFSYLLLPLSSSAIQRASGLACCAEADGHPLDESEWDIKNDSYRVFLKDKWIVVPDEAVISSPNKLGKAIVWLWPYDVLRGGGGDNPIRCFIPGSGV
jgi:hypothetical protein